MDMSVNIAGVEWKNPVTVASGTFGSGAEFADYVDINKLGAVTTKGVANVPWAGNPTPRVAEVYGGMMNAIGLQNPGIDLFCERDIPFLKQYDTKIIVNVCGHAPEEYLAVVERLADEPIDMMEINISCPNVNAGFLAFGQDAKHVEELTAQIKKIAKQPVIMKLTPNVTDITEIKASDGKLYVSAVFDCFDSSVIGLAMDTNMKAPLCVQTLENTAKAYPGIRGAIIHSDRGSQYTSQLYRDAVRQYGIQQSMNSAGGRCHDNARCESMWARMKSELLYDRYDTEKRTTGELKTIIWRYFISYWNNRRICSANGGLPPMVKRQQYYDSLKEAA